MQVFFQLLNLKSLIIFERSIMGLHTLFKCTHFSRNLIFVMLLKTCQNSLSSEIKQAGFKHLILNDFTQAGCQAGWVGLKTNINQSLQLEVFGMDSRLANLGRGQLKQKQQSERCLSCSYMRTPQHKIDLKTKNILQKNALVLKNH